MRRVKAYRGDVAEGAHLAALPRGAERVAGVLNQPQVVLLAEGRHRIHIEDIAQGVRNHHGLGIFAARRFELTHIHFVARQRDIEKDRHAAVLQDRVYRRGEARTHGDHLIARFDLPVAQLGRGQRAEGHQIRRRAGVHQARRADADKARQLAFKVLGPASGREPRSERRFHHCADVMGIDHLAGNWDGGLPRHERTLRKLLGMKLVYQGQDLLTKLFRTLTHKNLKHSKAKGGHAVRRRGLLRYDVRQTQVPYGCGKPLCRRVKRCLPRGDKRRCRDTARKLST